MNIPGVLKDITTRGIVVETNEIKDGALGITQAEINQSVSKSSEEITDLKSSKQDKLVSGTNIKTVAGTSILGSGDISLSGFAKTGQQTNITEFVNNAGYITSADVADVDLGDLVNIKIAAEEGEDVTPEERLQYYANPGVLSTGGEVEKVWKVVATKDEVANKQAKLVSGTNIKTINNQSILGSGNITISTIPTLATVATTGNYHDLLRRPIVVSTDSPDYTLAKVDGETPDYTSGSYLWFFNGSGWTRNVIASDLNTYATRAWVTSQLSNISSGGTVDLSGYLTTDEVKVEDGLLKYYNGSAWITAADETNVVQSNWNITDNTNPAFIKNKPSLATIATSGKYADITQTSRPVRISNNAPEYTLESIDGATSGIDSGKYLWYFGGTGNGWNRAVVPSELSTVATSGSYNDLTDKPVIVAYTSGTRSERPSSNLVVGQEYFDTTLGKPIWWNGSRWVDKDGYTAYRNKGTQMLAAGYSLASTDAGFRFFISESDEFNSSDRVGKNIYWTGGGWVDNAGTSIKLNSGTIDIGEGSVSTEP